MIPGRLLLFGVGGRRLDIGELRVVHVVVRNFFSLTTARLFHRWLFGLVAEGFIHGADDTEENTKNQNAKDGEEDKTQHTAHSLSTDWIVILHGGPVGPTDLFQQILEVILIVHKINVRRFDNQERSPLVTEEKIIVGLV